MTVEASYKPSHRASVRIPFRERVTCTLGEAIEATGISRSHLYRLRAAGRVETVMVDGRRLWRVRSLLALVGDAGAGDAP
jgi:hypothetical protein